MKIKAVFLALFLLIGVCITGCGNEKEWNYNANIIEFNYEFGGYDSGYYYYNIIVEGDKINFLAKGKNGIDLNIEQTIDKSHLEKLENIIKKYDLGKWDGFDKADSNIMDGGGFSLEIKYSDGSTIKAHGSNKYPKNYDEVSKEIKEVLENIE